MSIVNVAEYPVVTTNSNGGIQIPLGTPLVTYDIAVAGSATQGPNFNIATKLVRLNTDVPCRVRMDTNILAGAQDVRFAANQTEYWGVPGPGMSISTLTST